MFLCSHCKTEQEIKNIIAEDGMKECLCPKCEQVCCADYCVFFNNGRWNVGEIYLDEPNEWLEKQQQEYEQTKREYGIVDTNK